MHRITDLTSSLNLYEADDSADLRILLITGGWQVRRSFSQMGIQTGDHIRVLRRAPFGGPVMVDNQGSQVAIGKELAEKVQVEILP
jgi:ferrous iron transport protein A